ncbi:MAG: DUF4129 domain-containing protein [Tannerella sp.]|jgi:hypothetical protein|nr:DUF4129 domain-containing protein [Tannerella sp.]
MIHLSDTIIYDAAKIAEYQADKRFDYNSQLQIPEFDLMDIILRWLSRMLDKLFGVSVSSGMALFILIAFIVVFLLVLGYFIYKKRPELFMREKKTLLPYEVEAETIYGIDFEKELKAALMAGDFKTSVRLLYLQTLRSIADRQWIDWQIYKTPTEYIYELKPAELKTPFRDFTNSFLQVRYGNFKATRELFDSMSGLSDQLKKGEHDER